MLKKIMNLKLLAFLKTAVFLSLYILGLLFLPSLAEKGMRFLTNSEWVISILSWDFGRFFGRLVSFFWVIFLYFFMECIIFRKAVNTLVFFEVKTPVKTFLNGSLVGGGLVLLLIGATILTGAVTVNAWIWNPSAIILTLLLYFFAMLLTAASEELALRGFSISQLREGVGSHGAVFVISILFGLLHLPSMQYAFMAFLAGVILGYAFLSYGIYYVIGWHFCWNWIETAIFSGKIMNYRVNNILLAGNRLQSPDQEGVLCYPILIVTAIFYFLKFQKRRI